MTMKIIQESCGKIMSYSKKGLKIACGQGFLYLKEVQLEGKKAPKNPAFSARLSIKNGRYF